MGFIETQIIFIIANLWSKTDSRWPPLIDALSKYNACNSVIVVNTELKYGMVIAESSFHNILEALTDQTRSLFKVLACRLMNDMLPSFTNIFLFVSLIVSFLTSYEHRVVQL